MRGKLFSFGCSLSSQVYPTWNEMLGLYFDQHHNFGKGGAGNKWIFTALMSKIADGAIGCGDTVVVQWSSNHRYDWYRDGEWRCGGNVLNRSDLTTELGRVWFDEIASTVDACTFALAASHVLDGLGCDWYMACFHDITRPMGWESNPIDVSDPMLDRYRTALDRYSMRWANRPIYGYCFDSGLRFKEWILDDGSSTIDTHPTPMMAYAWLRDCLLPIMGLDHTMLASKALHWQGIHDGLTRTSQLREAYAEISHWWNGNQFWLDRVNPS